MAVPKWVKELWEADEKTRIREEKLKYASELHDRSIVNLEDTLTGFNQSGRFWVVKK